MQEQGVLYRLAEFQEVTDEFAGTVGPYSLLNVIPITIILEMQGMISENYDYVNQGTVIVLFSPRLA